MLFVTLLVACSEQTTDKNKDQSIELTVSAAVSLTDALTEIEEIYGKEHNISFRFNFGSSGTLAQQIKQGAPVDIFISANEDWMDALEKDNEIDVNTRKDITGNTIVLIKAKGKEIQVQSIDKLTKENSGQIAIGNPESVPAGSYTKELLMNIDRWDELKDNIIQAKNVRQVLTYIETGNAEIGFVYGSDTILSNRVEMIDQADTDLHQPIIYPGAVTTGSKQKTAALEFLKYLESAEAQEILAKYGFQK